MTLGGNFNMLGAAARLKARLDRYAGGVRAKCGKISDNVLSKAASINNLRAASAYKSLTDVEDISEYQNHALNTSIVDIICQYFVNLSSTLNKSESEMATIYVGKDQHKFFIHEILLSLNSDFFQVCLKDGNSYRWKEGRQHKVELPEDDPAVFAMFVRYLYTRRCIILPNDKLLKVEGPDGRWKTLLPGEFLFRCYIFAEKILASSFKNKLIAAIIHGLTKDLDDYFHPFLMNAALLWEELPENSKLRSLYLDVWAWSAEEQWLCDSRAPEGSDIYQGPFEFWQQLVGRLIQFRKEVHYAENIAVFLNTAVSLDKSVNTAPWIFDKTQYFDLSKKHAAHPPLVLQQKIRRNLLQIVLSEEVQEI